jgi:hypothetical protein
MSSTGTEQVFDTPEAAQANVRRGRRCYFLTVRGPRGWAAYDYAYSTLAEVTGAARLAMEKTAPACVVVFGRAAERVHIPTPRARKAGAP